jgi:predicted nucleic acid-binding protein
MIIADTGFFVDLGNRRDQSHQTANQQLSLLRELLITTYPVIVETSYLLAERCGQMPQFKFLQQLTSGSKFGRKFCQQLRLILRFFRKN